MGSPMRCIPKVVHFVNLVKPANELVPFIHFAAIASARSILRPDKIIMHLHGQPRGPWWEGARLLVDEIKHVDLPTQWRADKPIHNYAHMADYIRIHVLAETGGIYLDMDTIAVRPVDDLLHHEVVMGRERSNTVPRLCNAVVMAAPKAPFLMEWLRQYPDVFVPTGWAEASVELPPIIAQQRPDLAIHIEPETSFFEPSWDNVAAIFETPNEIDPRSRIQHLWGNGTFESHMLKVTGMDWARQNMHTLCAKLLINAEKAWIRDGIDYQID